MDDPLGVLTTCDVSDACDELGITAWRTGAIGPAWPGCPSVLGELATIRLEPAAAGTPLSDLLEVLPKAAGRVLLVDLQGRVDLQCWGGVLAVAARSQRVKAAIVNGATRDVGELIELSFPTYAKGVAPVRIKGRLRFVGFDVPVDVEGIEVRPRWWAAADVNGVALFPGEQVDQVLELATEREARERERRHAVLAGADPAIFLETS